MGKPYVYQELVSCVDLQMCILTHVLLHRPKVVLDSPHGPWGCHEESRPGPGAQIGSVRVKLEDLVSPSGRRVYDKNFPDATIPKPVCQCIRLETMMLYTAYTQRVKLSQCW